MSCPSGYHLVTDPFGVKHCVSNTGGGESLPVTGQTDGTQQGEVTVGIVYPNFEGLKYASNLNDWVGPFERYMISDAGKMTFGIAPQGPMSDLEPLILLAALAKLGQTPDGRKIIQTIAVHYIDGLAKILVAMHQSSSSHVLTGIINQYIACAMYQRLGLMSPHDATQCRAWLDHQVGENLKVDYIMGAMGHITTLVNSTNESRSMGGASGITESAAGLAGIVKAIAGAGA